MNSDNWQVGMRIVSCSGSRGVITAVRPKYPRFDVKWEDGDYETSTDTDVIHLEEPANE